MLTRNEAYRKNAHKENLAVEVFEDFLKSKIKLDYETVEDYLQNWLYGDIKLENNRYIEIKGQPINPKKYNGLNFVEVAEKTQNPKHADGCSKLSEILERDISTIKVRNKITNTVEQLGTPQFLNIAISSLYNGTSYAYVNHSEEIVYLYSAKKLLSLIKESINTKGMTQGAGRTHIDTLGVQVPIPVAIWQKENGEWKFIGSGNESAILEALTC